MKRLLSAVGVALFLAAAQASADIMFTIPGALLSDGGTLTGTFVTDDAAGALLDYDFITSGGTATGFEYTPATAPVSFTSLPSIIVVETALADHILQIAFPFPPGLTTLGAPILIGSADSFEQVGAVHRDITSGSAAVAAAPVPEPSTLALLGIVLSLMTFVVRRRQG